MTTLIQLQKKIVDNYSEKMTADEINQAISHYFFGLKPSKSTIDPTRLGTRSNFISKLRLALLEDVGPLDMPTQLHETRYAKFNKMTAKEQLKFQAQALATGTNKWVHSLEIMPKNIADIKMSAEDMLALKNLRAKVDTDKLRDESVEVDGDRLIEKLCPALLKTSAKRHQLAAALLLVTGRRTVELLKTGDFYLPKGGSVKDYTAMFSGQAKEGLFPGGAYEIPLLAPYWLVKAAFKRLRELYDTADLGNADINESFASSIGNFVKSEVDLTPHALRGAYAMMTYELMNTKKMSLVGWISLILGHAQPSAAAYYQRMKIVNLSGPYKPRQMTEQDVFGEDEPENGPETLSDWNVSGAAEKKRVVAIQELMEKRIKLTASSIKTNTGGSTLIINRIMAKNAALINEYNASLE